ncbi:helix-turn-helix domain-containing protein [Paenibacillus sp. MMS18-CY102]|nr:helix-turn-helix domain-containing protein [Paenibacillus sp. MMS18-CY102]
MDFVAIDFETANSNRSSACSVGLVEVQNGLIVSEQSWLIDPKQHFDGMNIGVHGITPSMVAGKPSFEQLWPTLQPMLEGKHVVAHNASFDMSVLRYCLDNSTIQYPSFQYYCTYLFAKRLIPDLPSYRLNDLARLHYIPLNHHDALDDAKACAILLLNLLHNHECDSPIALSKEHGYKIGKLFMGGYTPFSAPAANKAKKKQYLPPQAEAEQKRSPAPPSPATEPISLAPVQSKRTEPTPARHSSSLIRGQKIDVTKNESIDKLLAEVEWDLLNPDIDLDSSAFLLDANNVCTKDDDCIFYGNPDHRNGSVAYHKINSNKAQFKIAFDRLAFQVQKIAFSLTIYEGEELSHSFSQVSEIRIRLLNDRTGKEIASFSFGEGLTQETAIVIGELYVYKGEWKFNPIGSGFFGGLRALCLDFGLEVQQSLPEVAADAQSIASKDIYDVYETFQIGQNVERVRRSLSTTQKQLAEKIGYKSANLISRLERGELDRFSHAQLIQLAEALNVTTRHLLSR